MKTLALGVCIVLALASTTWAADWKWIGGLDKKEDPIMAFYDTQSVTYLSNKNVRVWIEGVKTSNLEKTRKANEKQIIDSAAKKLAHGYIAPYSTVEPNTSFDDNLSIIALEETMKYVYHPHAKIFYEINCSEKKIKTLSAIVYREDGTTTTGDFSDEKWGYIPPDSNSEVLEKLLCK